LNRAYFCVILNTMLFSKTFAKTRKEAPKDEISKNAELLIRGGFINKEMAGVYAYLPLGLRVLGNIERVVREEMDAIGGQEILMTTLQNPEIWKKTGRWNDAVVDNWFKTQLKTGGDVGIANTHEEPITELLTHFVSSYKDLPLALYQFQTKFRNELRAKSGILRTREFLMKDLYSFSRSENEFKEFYEKCADAYMKIFKRIGIGEKTYRTIAGGGSFTAGLTHEFQTLSDAGEDIIYVDEKRRLAINKEAYTDENCAAFKLKKEDLIERKSIEVGNIFPLGSVYAQKIGLFFTDEDGKKMPVFMGSYGIGLPRLMGTVVEVLSDEKGIVWPHEITPYQFHILHVPSTNDRVKEAALRLYEDIIKAGFQVLYDDRDLSAGVKFADADLIGAPFILIVSEKTLQNGLIAEIKFRKEGAVKPIPALFAVSKWSYPFKI